MKQDPIHIIPFYSSPFYSMLSHSIIFNHITLFHFIACSIVFPFYSVLSYPILFLLHFSLFHFTPLYIILFHFIHFYSTTFQFIHLYHTYNSLISIRPATSPCPIFPCPSISTPHSVCPSLCVRAFECVRAYV